MAAKTELFSRVDHGRTADEVCAQIEALLLEGVLRVGDKLPGERDLAEQFSVSRPIVRQALKTLEERGLVCTRHGGGTYVADVIGDVFSRPMLELIAGHPKATDDYLEYRWELEAIAAEYAALRATADDKALLTAIIERMRAAHDKPDASDEAAIDVEFHQSVCEAAHNVILMHTLRSCYRLLSNGSFFSRSLVYGLPGARDELLDQHCAIYRAIMDGNPQAARRAAQAHIAFVQRSSKQAEKVDAWQTASRLRRELRKAG